MNYDYDHLFLILLIGDDNVGKSGLVNRFADNTFNENFPSTIGVDFKTKTVRMDGRNAKLQIWDTAGHERFRSITNSYYRGAHGIFIVYDTTNLNSFNNIKIWLEGIDQNASESVVKVLVGSKCDLVSERAVEYEKAKSLADILGISYIETSSKNCSNVEEAFILISKELFKRETTSCSDKQEIQIVDLSELKVKKKSSCC
ncbi:ras-related protein rabd2a-like [Anaeramoeba flamelloides]|uniref:Ras-related protein rabd2a-like n=1 Tax=Anaeramoeba flamelloides TaxID=1746091 RepID=A0AAV7YZD9_9EUKA|nr:ras-related protein rabd2a-like [Anaeramoeba flamelloides]